MIQTQVRLSQNTRTFGLKRKYVFSQTSLCFFRPLKYVLETVLKTFRNVHLQGVLTGKRVGRYLNGVCEAKENCHFFQKKIVDNFGSFEKRTTFALAIGKMMNGCGNNAEIAQLVEHNLAKVRVASSSLVFRSAKEKSCAKKQCPGGGMVDAHVSGACVERHAGSSPVLGTTKTILFFFFLEEWRNW